MSEQNWTAEEIELAKVLDETFESTSGTLKNIRLAQSRAALKWCANHPPAMSDEERMEKIGMVWRDTECTERHVLEGSLVKAGLIPPRREKSIGEIVRDIVLKSDPSLAAGKIDELLGKLVKQVEYCRDSRTTSPDFRKHCVDALAPIEALKAVQKKE